MSKRDEYFPHKAEDTTDRLPPNSIEAEQSVLGCILLAAHECLAACMEQLRAGASMFYDVRHQTLYATLVRMFEKQQAIDVITVQQQLKDDGALDQIGGIAYLAGLPDLVPSAANLAFYLAIVREKHKLRRMIAVYADAISRIYAHEGEVDGLLEQVAEDVSQLTETETPQAERHLKEIIKANLTTLEEWHYSQGSAQINGLTTGPKGNYLDKMLAGIADDDMGVIAGRPGSGKTSLALNLVKHAAQHHVRWEKTGEFHPLAEGEPEARPVMREVVGVPVAIFSLEMTAESLGMRLIFDEAGVDMAAYRTGFAKADAQDKLCKAALRLTKLNIYIDDASGLTMGQIAAKARRMARQHGIKLFVLDYLQLISSESDRGDNRVRELEKVANKIVQLKKQLKVPWLVLAQMNRNIETAEKERPPVMSDLKDCGAIEQAADWILFSYKTPYKQIHEPQKDANGIETGPSDAEIIQAVAAKEKWSWGETPYRVSLIIAKHRDGPVGPVETVFQKNLCRFEDWHLFKARHGMEGLKAGESKALLGQPDFGDVTNDFPEEGR